MSWIPLHLYSQYSILDATSSIEELVAQALAYKMPSLALTDQGNMYGAVEFYKACKAAKIKPIIGCVLNVAPGSRHDKKRIPGTPHGFPIVLLAKNQIGYKNLCKLASFAHLEGFYYTPRIDKELLTLHSEGLICLSGPLQGRIGYLVVQGKEEELLQEIKWYSNLFQENYYFELQRHQMKVEDIRADELERESWAHQLYLEHVKNQERVIARLSHLSKELGIPCVATVGSRYMQRSDWRAHEILINVQSGEPCEIWEKDSQGNPKARVSNPKRQITATHELYFKSPEEMAALFHDLPEAVAISSTIADSCSVEFDFSARHYPIYLPPHLEGKEVGKEERLREVESFLRKLCLEGIPLRYQKAHLDKVAEKYPEKDPLQVVQERLAYELNIIISKGMCDYLLIVYDFIAWAKNKGIPVGPGRGSGAGSIILYLIGITDIEPIRFNLFFERFINPERFSYPDIDVDICMERRQEVIDYTMQKYGKERVAQIITFGTMKAKMALRDVGRVLSIPLAQVNAIAKLIPEDPNMTLDKALEIDPELKKVYEGDQEIRGMIDLARKLEGSVRSTGIHAAGMIICADPLMEHIPLCSAKDAEIAVTQYSMKPLEQVGLLKIDFLGLKTLTSIQSAVFAIEANGGQKIDWVDLPLEDKATFDLLNQGKTLGLFQLESGGMQDLAKQLHIDKFEEIIAVGALYRPGPMEMIPSFINRKHGREPIEIDHPLVADILSETYGIMVYQEQVMQIASHLAGYTLGEGDVLRRAMGKKDREEMARQREKFVKGAQKNGVEEAVAARIFDKIEKFASYGFNKSHAAAYGYLTYVTAYLKANYPKEWMAALLTSDRDDVTKVSKILRECHAMQIAILPPDINESAAVFAATVKGIRFAMAGIKGIGEGVVEAILKERSHRGPFTTLFDFFKRMDGKKVGKKSVELLIEAGGFDFTSWSRQALLESVEPMHAAALKQQKEDSRGVMSLFSLIEEDFGARFSTPPPVKEKVSKQKVLKKEKELLGFYLSGHPMDDFRTALKKLSCVPLSLFEEMPADSVCRIAVIVESVQIKISAKSQKKFAILSVSDGYVQIELPIWPELYEDKHHLIVENQLLYAVVQLEKAEGEMKLQCRWLGDLAAVDEKMMQECDTAYDRAKRMSRTPTFSKEKTMKPPAKTQKISRVSLIVDGGVARLSHIIQLKEIFRAHGGSTPVHVEFWEGQQRRATIQISDKWGVDPTKQLEEALGKLSIIKKYESS